MLRVKGSLTSGEITPCGSDAYSLCLLSMVHNNSYSIKCILDNLHYLVSLKKVKQGGGMG